MFTRRNLMGTAIICPIAALRAQAGKAPLKYLQIGVGHAHANKIQVYQESPDWDVIGIVEENPKLLAKAKNNDAYKQFPLLTLEEGLNMPGLSVVGIETEIGELLKYASVAISAGKHVHLDKPAGSQLEPYQKLMEEADAGGLVVQMGYMYRHNPAIRLLHRILDAGWLGEVFETHAVMSKVISDTSRQVLDGFSGGTMFELGGHIIDLTIDVLGAPSSVSAFPRRTVDKEGDTLIDNMLAVLEYPKATATVRSTGLEVEGSGRRHFTVCGTEGTCHIQPLDRPKMKLSLSRDRKFSDGGEVFRKGTTEIPFEPPYRRYVGDAAQLAAIVRGEIKNPYPSSHDLAVQEALLEASNMRKF
ncbi:MAG: dehydrogenase [Verrucomicrobiales bacterium]|nr:dehydrogenase [Verrucomicrobiales bacterium]